MFTKFQERHIQFLEILDVFYKKIPLLLEGADLTSQAASFQNVLNHCERLWRDAVLLFNRGSFPTACFLAINCLEQVGKAVPTRLALKVSSLKNEAIDLTLPVGIRRKDNPFYKHPEKHFLAAGFGVLFSPRLIDTLGKNDFDEVLTTMETHDLERLREQCLYVDFSDTGLNWPEIGVSKEESRKWIIVAGECLLTVLGFPENQWQRLRSLIKDFGK